MTINSEIRRAGPFPGNGVTTEFPFDFKVFKAEDLYVVVAPEGSDSELPLEPGTDYTVILNPDQDANPGGTIVAPAPLPVGFTLTATSALEYLQPVDLTNQGGFYPRVINDGLDRLTIFVQQLSEGVGRSLKIPLSDGPISTVLPGRSERAGKLIAFDSAGQPTVAVPAVGSATELGLALADPDKGAAMVALDRSSTYPSGTVGEGMAIRRITAGTIRGTLSTTAHTGRWRVSGVSDGPGYNGMADVTLQLVGGQLYGYCVMTSYSSSPPEVSVMTCSAGVWGDWRRQAFKDELSFSSLTEQGGMINLAGVPVSADQIVPICRGSYSWWNEPQSIALGTLSQKMVVGAVSAQPGAHKLVQVKATGNTNQTELAYLPDAARYAVDEHNGPVTIEAGDGIVSFFPGHNDRTYLPYWVGNAPDISSLGTTEHRISPGVGNISYAQAWYTDHIPTQAPRVWCAFRAGGATGANRTWYITWSENWDAAEPVWTTHPLVTDTDQMYLRMVWRPDRTTPVVRFIGTKNASYDTTNGLWFGYVDLRTSEIKTSMGAVVGELDDTPVQLTTDLTKIYSAPRRIRLYDALGDATSVPMLISTFAGGSGGPYRYVRYDISTWSISHDVEIVASGPDMQTGSYYFGGAHFSNVSEGGVSAVGPGPIYVARASGGVWLLEEYATADGGDTWSLVRVIDSSTTEKIWRPRVPYNTRQRYQPRQVVLTYCKGQWNTYTDFDSTVYAVMRTVKTLG